jgi:hypothetical protein
MLHADARRAAEGEKLRSFDPHSSIDDHIILADEDGRAEAERTDRIRHVPHVGRVELTDLAHRQSQILQGEIVQIERWQGIVTRTPIGRRAWKSRKFFAAPATPCLQLTLERSGLVPAWEHSFDHRQFSTNSRNLHLVLADVLAVAIKVAGPVLRRRYGRAISLVSQPPNLLTQSRSK